MSESGESSHDLHRALGDHVAAVLAGAGTHVDDPVGGAHHLLVVLDDDQRVADVAQAYEGPDQARVVALVEADARLIEDVEHAHEAGADLRRQPDALRLAAGEGVGGAVQGQVIEADVDQEAEPRPNLLEDLAGDQVLALGQHASVCVVRVAGELGEPLLGVEDARRVDSMIFSSPTVTASTSGLRRAPLQVGQGRSAM